MTVALDKSSKVPTKIEGENFTVLHTGESRNLDQYTFRHPSGKRVAGKLFLKDHMETTGMEISLNKFAAGWSMPFAHAHQENEEVYVFTGGKGQMQIDNQTFNVEEGTVVRVAPKGVRIWRNISNEDLYFIVIQARQGSLTQETFEDGIHVEREIKWPD